MAARRTSLTDVAARAGVSRSTASLVLRDDPGPAAASRVKVFAAAAELGYVPDAGAQRLRSRRSRVLGVVFSPRAAFHADLLDHLYPAAAEHDHALVLGAVSANRSAATAAVSLVGARCEALVALGGLGATEELAMVHGHVPVVEIGRGGQGVDAVTTDDALGISRAIDHLVDLGHRSIALVSGGDASGADERRRGYHEAMSRHGLGEHARVVAGAYTEAAGAAAAEELRDDLPSAIVAANDDCALGLLDALRRAGHPVPGRVSIVGFDDSSFSRLNHVDLTTVAQDAATMARAAVAAAVARAEGDKGPPVIERTEPILVVRGTTGPVGPSFHPAP